MVIDISTDRVVVPDPVAAVAAAYGTDPLGWVLSGGHDHARVAAFASDADLPEDFAAIGTVGVAEGTDPEVAGADRVGVRVDGAPWAGSPGHRHFG